MLTEYLVIASDRDSGRPFLPFLVPAADAEAARQLCQRSYLIIHSVEPYAGSEGEKKPRIYPWGPPASNPSDGDDATLPPEESANDGLAEIAQAAEDAWRKKREDAARPVCRTTRIGLYLLGVCAACLLIGRAVVTIFFPERRGAGLDATALAILIPIWTIGGLGLLLFVIGKIQDRRAQR